MGIFVRTGTTTTTFRETMGEEVSESSLTFPINDSQEISKVDIETRGVDDGSGIIDVSHPSYAFDSITSKVNSRAFRAILIMSFCTQYFPTTRDCLY